MPQEGVSRLWIDLRHGESIAISGGQVRVELIQKLGKVARLCVTAPRSVSIKKETREACAPRGKHELIAGS